MQTEKKYDRIAVIRAIPMQGHKRRWAGLERWIPDAKNRPQQEMEELPQGGFKPVFKDGKPVYAKHALPWPDFEVKVGIVDEPCLFDPEANGGVPLEISPSSVELIRQDQRIAIQVVNGEGGDATADVEAKARMADLEKEVQDLRRRAASEHERIDARVKAESAKQAKQMADKDAEIAELRAKLAEKKR